MSPKRDGFPLAGNYRADTGELSRFQDTLRLSNVCHGVFHLLGVSSPLEC